MIKILILIYLVYIVTKFFWGIVFDWIFGGRSNDR